RLDRGRAGAAAGLDHVRVQRALDEEGRARVAVRRREAPGLLLEHADELLADGLALGLGVGHAREPAQEALLRVDGYERHLERVAKGAYDLFALVLAHQAVLDEHACEMIADGAAQEERGHR